MLHFNVVINRKRGRSSRPITRNNALPSWLMNEFLEGWTFVLCRKGDVEPKPTEYDSKDKKYEFPVLLKLKKEMF